jgi:hypothetical protein
MRRYLSFMVLTNLIMIFPTLVSAQVKDAEFNGLSSWELTFGEAVQTDCSIEIVSQKTGKIYCFSSESAKASFELDSEGNAEKARMGYKELAN